MGKGHPNMWLYLAIAGFWTGQVFESIYLFGISAATN
jgi:hypothetical protein